MAGLLLCVSFTWSRVPIQIMIHYLNLLVGIQTLVHENARDNDIGELRWGSERVELSDIGIRQKARGSSPTLKLSFKQSRWHPIYFLLCVLWHTRAIDTESNQGVKGWYRIEEYRAGEKEFGISPKPKVLLFVVGSRVTSFMMISTCSIIGSIDISLVSRNPGVKESRHRLIGRKKQFQDRS